MLDSANKPIAKEKQPFFRSRVHYGVWILVIGILTNFGCVGLGRFAIGMIIPEMSKSLDMTNTQLGVIVSSTFLGYLASTIVSGAHSVRFGPRKIIFISMLLVSAGMVIAGFASGFWAALAGQLLIGIGAGGSNVPTFGLVARWFSEKYRGTASGFVLMGSGLGFTLAGTFVPYMLSLYGTEGWRVSWFYLSLMVLLIAILGGVFFRNSPSSIGVSPVGGGIDASSKINRDRLDAGDSPGSLREVFFSKPLWGLGFIYFMFGFSYVVFTTFFC